MATNLRKMGFHVKSQIPWGTHFCLFYETKEDLLDTLVPYSKAGLEGNEFCAWLALNQAVPPFERNRFNQSIEVLRARDWYLNGGHFELDRVTSAWNRNLTQARQNQQAEFAR